MSSAQAAKIRMLPLVVANQIAAGEVVERPASVVKELVENSVDSGATRIDVTITAGGRKLVSVADDGCGMVRDDAIMAIERQATSKIRTSDDIEHISTLGFRGEALASIASVSRFLLRTRPRDREAGTEVEVVGGTLRNVGDCGCPVGTTIEVRDIFFNLPARRKFLRTYQTEQAHIKATFIVQALSRPDLGMSLRSDGYELHRLPPCDAFEDRLRDIFGPDRLRQLLPIDYKSGDTRVSGYIASPAGDWSRADRAEQFFFINHRATAAPLLYHALREAYPALEGKRNPALFLFLDMPPELVDINVHPTKREVRFRRHAEVRDTVGNAIARAIGRGGSIARHSQSIPPVGATLPADERTSDTFDTRTDSRESDQTGVPPAEMPRINPEQPLPFTRTAYDKPIIGGGEQLPRPPAEATVFSAPAGAPWTWCRDIGRLGDKYVLLETDDGYVVLDPQAAHARVLYEHLLKVDRSEPIVSQNLLLPQTVELPPADAQIVRDQLPVFRSMGFGIDALDADAFILDALPAALGNLDCRALLVDIATALAQAGPRKGRERRREESIARAASLAAVKNSARLNRAARERLIADLIRCRMPYTCPLGRPTMVFTSWRDLARRFGAG